MVSSDEPEEQAFFKCHFCNVEFVTLPSIVKHKKLYCARRIKLPRSATVTSSSMAALEDFTSSKKPPEGDESSSSESSSDVDVEGVSEESSSAPMNEPVEKPMMSFEDVAAFFRARFSAAREAVNSVATPPSEAMKPPTKRKVAEEEESKEDSSFLDEKRKSPKCLKQS